MTELQQKIYNIKSQIDECLEELKSKCSRQLQFDYEFTFHHNSGIVLQTPNYTFLLNGLLGVLESNMDRVCFNEFELYNLFE